jgi:hypothetical protein
MLACFRERENANVLNLIVRPYSAATNLDQP